MVAPEECEMKGEQETSFSEQALLFNSLSSLNFVHKFMSL